MIVADDINKMDMVRLLREIAMSQRAMVTLLTMLATKDFPQADVLKFNRWLDTIDIPIQMDS